jgi:HSP20 family molecular chaperone IbpA
MAAPNQALPSKAAVATAPSFVPKEEANSLDRAMQDRICERAYQLYQESGCQQGNDQQHWLQAESEVLRHGLEVRESGSWIVATGFLRGVPAEGVQIYVDARRIIVHAKGHWKPRDARATAAQKPWPDFFLVADLDAEVDPATAAAALKDERLSLMVKKRRSAKAERIEFASHH